MSSRTSIEWTEQTWNPVRGCSPASPGCEHCYAKGQAHRFSGPGKPYEGLTRKTARGVAWTGEVRLIPEVLDIPMRATKKTTYFVNSMSDLFHPRLGVDDIRKVFDVMVGTPRHTYQILTKRSSRLREVAPQLAWPSNIWMGVSVESPRFLTRLDDLREVPAAIRFVSFEPLLEPLGPVELDGIDWVIAGGESGPGARPMHADWIREIRDQCVAAGVAFFFKQWGDLKNNPDVLDRTAKQNGGASKGGRLLDTRIWDETPRRRSGS